MKKIGLILSSFIILFIAGVSCKTKIAPVSDRIKKTWTVQSVKENGTVVYTKGATNNTRPGYSNFSLNLASAPSVTLKEVDGNSFTGTYSLPTDTRLVLSALNPQPTGSNGTIEYTIISFSDTQMVLARTSTNPKTGNTTNEYTLVSQ